MANGSPPSARRPELAHFCARARAPNSPPGRLEVIEFGQMGAHSTAGRWLGRNKCEILSERASERASEQAARMMMMEFTRAAGARFMSGARRHCAGKTASQPRPALNAHHRRALESSQAARPKSACCLFLACCARVSRRKLNHRRGLVGRPRRRRRRKRQRPAAKLGRSLLPPSSANYRHARSQLAGHLPNVRYGSCDCRRQSSIRGAAEIAREN